jgi:hypothetical protein
MIFVWGRESEYQYRQVPRGMLLVAIDARYQMQEGLPFYYF